MAPDQWRGAVLGRFRAPDRDELRLRPLAHPGRSPPDAGLDGGTARQCRAGQSPGAAAAFACHGHRSFRGASARGDDPAGDRKSTRLNPVTNAQLVCRFTLEKKKETKTKKYRA